MIRDGWLDRLLVLLLLLAGARQLGEAAGLSAQGQGGIVLLGLALLLGIRAERRL